MDLESDLRMRDELDVSVWISDEVSMTMVDQNDGVLRIIRRKREHVPPIASRNGS